MANRLTDVGDGCGAGNRMKEGGVFGQSTYVHKLWTQTMVWCWLEGVGTGVR